MTQPASPRSGYFPHRLLQRLIESRLVCPRAEIQPRLREQASAALAGFGDGVIECAHERFALGIVIFLEEEFVLVAENSNG